MTAVHRIGSLRGGKRRTVERSQEVEADLCADGRIEVMGFLRVERHHKLEHHGNLRRIERLLFREVNRVVRDVPFVVKRVLVTVDFTPADGIEGAEVGPHVRQTEGAVGSGEAAAVNRYLQTGGQTQQVTEVVGVAETGTARKGIRETKAGIRHKIVVNLVAEVRHTTEQIDVELMGGNPLGLCLRLLRKRGRTGQDDKKGN